MRVFHFGKVAIRFTRHAWINFHVSIAAMTIGTTQHNRRVTVHVLAVSVRMAAHTTCAFFFR